MRLIRKRKQEEIQTNGGQDLAIALHQSPRTKLMRPLLPLADPNVLEENKIIGRKESSAKLSDETKIIARKEPSVKPSEDDKIVNEYKTRLSEDNKIVSRSQSLEDKPLVSDKLKVPTYALVW